MSIYDIDEFATRLSELLRKRVTVANIKYHLYRSRRLNGVGKRKGHSLVFGDEDVEAASAILANMPPPGRRATPLDGVENRQAEALRLFEQEKLTKAEIARRLGYTPGGVTRALKSAKAKKIKK